MARRVASTGASAGASAGAMERVEIVTRGARRDYTAEEKAAFPTEAAEPGARVLTVAQRHGISPSLIHRWRREAEGRPVKHKKTPRPPRLVPLTIGPGVPAGVPEPVAPLVRDTVGAAVEVVPRNGRVLRLGGGADVAAVARLAAALEA